MQPSDAAVFRRETSHQVKWSVTPMPDGAQAPVVWIHPFDPVVAAGVEAAGASLGSAAEADAFVVTHRAPRFPVDALHPGVRWVQLGTAGIDALLPAIDRDRIWTGARRLYAWPVAEYVLAAVLSAARGMPWRDRPTTPSRSVNALAVGVVGGGGIGARTAELLAGLGTAVHVFSRTGRAVPGARSAHPVAMLDEALPHLDVLVLAAPLTPETNGLMDARRLRALGSESWLINVGRGALVDTDALADALADGSLGGAVLDVTDPEPLPPEHRLRALDNAVLTPHVACPPETASELLARRAGENVRRLTAGLELIDVLDPGADY